MRKVLYILGKLKDADVDWLVSAGKRRRLPAGSALIQSGEAVESVYIVVDGRAEVSVADTVLNTVSTGEVVGELSFLDSRPPNASVTCTEETTVLAVPRPDLQAKLDSDDGFASRFYRALGVFLADRLRQTTQHVASGGSEEGIEEDLEQEGELDPAVLDEVALAGARFEWMLERLREADDSAS